MIKPIHVFFFIFAWFALIAQVASVTLPELLAQFSNDAAISKMPKCIQTLDKKGDGCAKSLKDFSRGIFAVVRELTKDNFKLIDAKKIADESVLKWREQNDKWIGLYKIQEFQRKQCREDVQDFKSSMKTLAKRWNQQTRVARQCTLGSELTRCNTALKTCESEAKAELLRQIRALEQKERMLLQSPNHRRVAAVMQKLEV